MQNQPEEQNVYGKNDIIQSISIRSSLKKRSPYPLSKKQMAANNQNYKEYNLLDLPFNEDSLDEKFNRIKTRQSDLQSLEYINQVPHILRNEKMPQIMDKITQQHFMFSKNLNQQLRAQQQQINLSNNKLQLQNIEQKAKIKLQPIQVEKTPKGLKESVIPYDWTYSLQPEFALEIEKNPDIFKPKTKAENFTVKKINDLRKNEQEIEDKIEGILKKNLMMEDQNGKLIYNPLNLKKPEKRSQSTIVTQNFNKTSKLLPQLKKNIKKKSIEKNIPNNEITADFKNDILKESFSNQTNQQSINFSKQNLNINSLQSVYKSNIQGPLPKDFNKDQSLYSFNSSKSQNRNQYIAIDSQVEGEISNFASIFSKGDQKVSNKVSFYTQKEELTNTMNQSSIDNNQNGRNLNFYYNTQMRAQFFKTGRSLRPSFNDNGPFSENKNMTTPIGKQNLKQKKMSVQYNIMPEIQEFHKKIQNVQKDTLINMQEIKKQQNIKPIVQDIIIKTARSTFYNPKERSETPIKIQLNESHQSTQKMSIHTPILKTQKSAEEEYDPWDFRFMTLQRSEETLEIGCLSPQQIKLKKDQVHQIKNMKAKKGDEMNLKQKDALIELMQYYSESCKYTGDPSKLSYILEQFSIGYMNQIDLLKALNQVKDLYTQIKLDNFVANFKYEYEANENPIENIERYKMKNEIDEILKFTDNVIYYKQQMIKQNKMLPQPPLVYLNMATVASDGTVNESYKHSKLYQNQPQLCEVARIASRLLIQIYQHDERFVIDEEDFKRVGIVFDDQDKQHQKKLCERHGQGKDLEKENNQRAQSKIQDFNQKLRENKKIPFQKQMKALIDVIRSSQNKEFVELRKKLQDSSKGRDFKFEDLRKLNPLIFLKDKEIKQEQISDEIYQQIEFHLKDQLFNENKICQFLNLPQSKEIKVNYLFLEAFVKTILPEFDLKDIQLEIQQQRQIQKNKNDSYFQAEEIPIETPTALYNDAKDMYKSKIYNEKIEIFKEKYKNLQFFNEQKKRYQNPKGLENSENNFYEELQKQKGQIIPVFNKIQNDILDLSGYPLDSKVASALSGCIKNKSAEQKNENFLIKKLLIDQIGLTDTDFSQILSSIEPLNSIQHIVYKNSEFFQKSFSELLKIILKMYSKDCSLEIIHFSKLKTDKFIIEQLLQKLDENPKLKVLKLQNLDLNTVNSAKYIGNQFQINASLTEVDISGC